jgi:CheY-like chemotaxis protein
VLVVEDDDDTRDVLKLGLELSGAEVRAVASARAALHTIAEYAPDVILSDIGLPEEDGLELIRQVRRLPAHHGRIPAAAVTAYTLGEDADAALRAGFQRHFRKPVETRELFQAVEELAHIGDIERRRGETPDYPDDRRSTTTEAAAS